MGKRYILTMMLATAVMAGCAQRNNSSGRFGTGYMSRANPNWSSFAVNMAGGNVTPSSPMDMSNFFTNYLNGDGSAFLLGCQISQIVVSANVAAAVSASFGGNTTIPSSGAQLHLDFIFPQGCMGTDPTTGNRYSDIRVDIADGTLGYVGASGAVVGNSASVSFQDEYGTITMSGAVNGGTFSGVLTYANNYYFGTNGVAYNPGYTGTLGQFSMNLCNLFICQ